MDHTFLLADADHQVERLPDRVRSAIGHESSATGIGFNQTLLTERLNRFANCGAAYPETLGQIAFRRKLVTRLELALEDRLLHLLDDLLVQSGGLHGAVQRLDAQGIHRFIAHSILKNL